MTIPGVNSELAAAIRRVNATFARLPSSVEVEVNSGRWQQLEDEIDQATTRGNVHEALAAVERWEAFALGEIREAVEATVPRPYEGAVDQAVPTPCG